MYLSKHVLIILVKTWVIHIVYANVDILNMSEICILESGVEQEFLCAVTEGDRREGIQWFVGDRLMPTISNLTEELDAKFQQTVRYRPRIEDDDAYLTCQSGMEESKVRLIIFLQQIIFISSLEVKKDGGGTIFLTAQLYPPPTAQDITWSVITQTDMRVMLRPGEIENEFSAEIIKKDTEDTYTFTFHINNTTLANLTKNVTLSIITLEQTQTVIFEMKMKTDEHHGVIISVLIWICVVGVVCVIITSLVITIITCVKMYRGEGYPIIGVRNIVPHNKEGYHRAGNQFVD